MLLTPSVAAGQVQSVGSVTVPLTSYPHSGFIAWSLDGKWLVVPDAPSYGGVISLYLLSVETGEKRRITVPPSEYDDLDPALSPDGRQLTFVRYAGGGGASSDPYVANLSPALEPEGKPERLTYFNRHVASPVWSANGLAILFTRTELTGNHGLWRIELPSRKIEPLPISVDSSSALNLSRGSADWCTRTRAQLRICGHWICRLKCRVLDGRVAQDRGGAPSWDQVGYRIPSFLLMGGRSRFSLTAPGQVKSGSLTLTAPICDSLRIREPWLVVTLAGRPMGRILSSTRARTDSRASM